MATKKAAKTPEAPALPRFWGFLVGHAFVPAAFHTRIRPPFFKTSDRNLADAVRKAKGTTELTPAQIEEYEVADAAISAVTFRERLKKQVIEDESDRVEAQHAAETEAAKAATAAQAAKQRAEEAADRVAGLEADSVKAHKTKTGEDAPTEDDDLFENGGGISLEDLLTMDEEELEGVLELYSITAPKTATRAVLLEIAQEAVKGNLVEQPKEGEASAADA